MNIKGIVHRIRGRHLRYDYHLYVAYSPVTDFVKIGMTRDLNRRATALHLAKFGEAVMCQVWFLGNLTAREAFRIEQAVHSEVGAVVTREDGEWFDCRPDQAVALVETALKAVR